MPNRKIFNFQLQRWNQQNVDETSAAGHVTVGGQLLLPDTTSPTRVASIVFEVRGSIGQIEWPGLLTGTAANAREDDLWKQTCFEVFYAGPRTSYFEHNFSPSSSWSVYKFEDYRKDMSLPKTKAPTFSVMENNSACAIYKFQFELLRVHANQAFGISAVMKSTEGQMTYWALSHAGDKPDFHLRESFQVPELSNIKE